MSPTGLCSTFLSLPSCFLGTEVTIFGREGGAELALSYQLTLTSLVSDLQEDLFYKRKGFRHKSLCPISVQRRRSANSQFLYIEK